MTMSWDSQMSGFAYLGEPPTPSATPTSATAPDFGAIFRTPKQHHTATFDHRGNWSTGDVVDTASFKTPQRVSRRTSGQRPLTATSQQGSFSEQDILNAELAAHVHHLSPNPNLSLPPVEPSRRLSSSPMPSPTRAGLAEGSINPFTPPKPESSFQNLQRSQSARSMQTPPPTRASGSKRKAKHSDVQETARSFSAGPKKLTTPGSNRAKPNGMSLDMLGESPQNFTSYQFSPDLFSYGMSGPATAPILPQADLFWDPNYNMSGMGMDFGGNSFFEQGLVRDDNFFSWGDMNKQVTPMQNTVNDLSTPFGGGLPDTSRAQQTSFNDMSHSTSESFHPFPVTASVQRKPQLSRTTSEASVNPNLLVTSSSPPPSHMQNSATLPGNMSQDNRQPYQHQKEQSRIEEMERAQRVQQQRGAQPRPQNKLTPKKSARPGLTRSATDSALGGNRYNPRRGVHLPLAIPQRNQNHENMAPQQRPSPVKSVATVDSCSGTPSPRTRTKVKFTIDANGRAKTETEVILDESESSTDTDIRKGLEGSWKLGESDSSADEDFNYTLSRNSSFTFPQQLPQTAPLSASASRSSTKGNQISAIPTFGMSRHSSMQSLSSLAEQPVRSQNNTGRMNAMGPFGDALDDPASEAETVVDADTDGDAQHALRKIVEARARQSRPAMSQSYSNNQFYSPSIRRVPVSRMPPASTPTYNHQMSSFNNISPTTITDPDSVTPSTDRFSQMSGDTRCVCGDNYNSSGLMIQCESCTNWLHVKCVGLNRNSLPAVYVCIFCTGQTPVTRGGRVRDPMRGGAIMPSSPLAHKSGRFR